MIELAMGWFSVLMVLALLGLFYILYLIWELFNWW